MKNIQNKAYLTVFGLLTLLLCNGGCFTGAKKLLHEVKGGEGRVMVMLEPSPTALLDYEYIQIKPFANEIDPLVPKNTPKILMRAIKKELNKEPRLYHITAATTQPASTLIVEGKIIHFQKTNLISSILSSYSQLICRVRLIDAKTNETIGRANCVGFSKALARAGLDELTEGVAEALKKWLTSEPETEEENDDQGSNQNYETNNEIDNSEDQLN